jgi:hypothetical protein
MSTLCGCFFVWYDYDYSTGIEGGSRLREQTLCLTALDNDKIEGKGGN